MIKLVVLLALVAAAAFFVPQFLEGTPNVCSAFEHRIGTLVKAQVAGLPPSVTSDPRLAGVLGALNGATTAGSGVVAEAYIRDKFPQLPPVAGCAAAYWKVTFDPDLTQYAKGKLPF
jgi:hypothetical protein